MAKKTEKTLLDFDQEDFDYAMKGLEEFKKNAEYLRSCFQLQELLAPELHEFTTADYQGILNEGDQYIADMVQQKFIETFDKLGPGMRSQYKNHKIYVDTSYGTDRLDRIIEDMTSSPPGRRSIHISPAMIEFVKGEAVIPESTIKSLKQHFSIYDDDPLAREVFELLVVGEVTLNSLQTLIDRESREAERKSGLKLARNIKIFTPKGTSQEGAVTPREKRGLFYLDSNTNRWKLNIKPFKL